MINKPKILIALAAYKEAENLRDLVNQIKTISPSSTILIINDDSGDGTREIIKEINYENLIYLERPNKLGLGTAHKLSIFYAIKFDYEFLLTMDADTSHDPIHIPQLLKSANSNNFVIGSRFCEGGKSDYSGIRKIISIMGNFVARNFLGIKLLEITTYYRVYSVKLLKKLPYNELNAQGYSLGVKIVWFMKKLNADLVEVPIHFKDRNKGKSKIPKFQIFISSFDLLILKLKDLFTNYDFMNENITYNFKTVCLNCNKTFFTLLKKKNYKCLFCNSNQEI
jgi:dolichol-phosphate mannosyltransferase